MNTDELIRTMAADDTQVKPVRQVLPLALLGAAAAAAVLFYASMGVRPDLAEALGQYSVMLKQTFPVVMTLAALGAVVRLAQPGGRLDGWAWALLVAPVVAVVAFWATALRMPMDGWAAAIAGHSVGTCLLCIPMIGLPILAATFMALRRGASTRPRLSGAMAGLLSGSASTAVYAAYCTEDSPMFWGVWYFVGIGIVVLIGALLGPRLLRW